MTHDLTQKIIMLLLNGDMEEPVMEEFTMQATKKFVLERHKQKITSIKSTGKKHGWYKTYVGTGRERKEVIRKQENDLYNYLFEYYTEQDNRAKTLSEVFEAWEEYKADYQGRSPNTIKEDKRIFKILPEEIKTQPIGTILEDNVRKNLIFVLKNGSVTNCTLEKLFHILGQIFRYGIKEKICKDNPMLYIDIRDYLKFCIRGEKSEEEGQFSKEELKAIRDYCWKHKKSVRALMILLSSETGMRIGELAALHKEDIGEEYIHVHRQQLRNTTTKPEIFYEVPYTKEERAHPQGGRYVPITPEVEAIIAEVEKIPGESDYFFHDPHKTGAISKCTYVQYLSRITHKIGTLAHHNHAFRNAYNGKLIELGFGPSDRALILGHGVPTNERNYSKKDRRRLGEIRQRLLTQ